MSLITEKRAIELLKNDGIVAIPTETVYGLAGNATSAVAIKKIYLAKNRPSDNPLICHFANIRSLKKWVRLTAATEKILKKFSPGPISVLVDLPPNSPLLHATGGRTTVICRIPAHKTAQKILSALPFPLAAPSANTSGHVSPTTAQMVEDDLQNRIDGTVDGGRCAVGIESTIVDCRNENFSILRPGKITELQINQLLRKKSEKNLTNKKNITPGSKYRHYAPIKKIMEAKNIRDAQKLLKKYPGSVILKTGHIEKFSTSQPIRFFNLGKSKTSVEKNLYLQLKKADQSSLGIIIFMAPNWRKNFYGEAIKNRLEKILA